MKKNITFNQIIFNFFLLTLLTLTSNSYADTTLTKVTLEDIRQATPEELATSTLKGMAKCMDGTQPAIYYDAAATSNNWVIILEGSNLCRGRDGNKASTPLHCQTWCNMDKNDREGKHFKQRNFCDYGQASSHRWPKTMPKSALFSSDSGQNLPFADAQKIFIPSCSGDGWMGTGATVTADENFGPLYFYGKTIIDEVIDHLINTGIHCTGDSECIKIQAGSKVLFGGESRGASGAWSNIDTVCDKVKSEQAECFGISASLFPGYYKNRLRDDGTKRGVAIPDTTWAQWIEITKARYAFQGIEITDECKAIFTDSSHPLINPVNDFELDPNDLSQDLCYTELALLKTLNTPSFISFNRYNDPGFSWYAGCELGLPYCYNNTVIREQEMEDIASQLPPNFSVYLATAKNHLYMVSADSKCNSPNNGCWYDKNDMLNMQSGATHTLSKYEALIEFVKGNPGKYWDTKKLLIK